MLTLAQGLSDADLAAIASLEQRTVAVDGGRLKLEWGTLRRRSGTRVDDVLWWQDGRLIGFVGVYSFGSTLEVAGMVDPGFRRRGIGGALLEAGMSLCRERGAAAALLVTSPAGAAFAGRRGLTADHVEHALVLNSPPTPGAANPTMTVRHADACDMHAVARLHADAFGHAAPDPLHSSADDAYATLLAEVDGRAVGTLRMTRTAGTAGVYGIAVHPQWQGRGIGRDLLRRACLQLRADGVDSIGLEVFVDNDRALGLYTSLGFTPVATEQYWRLAL